MLALLFLLPALASATPSPSSISYYRVGEEYFPYYLTEDDFAAACRIDDAELVVRNANPAGGGPVFPVMTADVDAVERDLEAFTIAKMWKDGNVPYVIEGFGGTDRAAIAKCIGKLQQVAGLKFTAGSPGSEFQMTIKPSSNNNGHCKTWFHFGGFGRVKAGVELPPKSQCTVPRTVCHEVMHGLGFFHTHQRQDRDEHVDIDESNFNPAMRDEFAKCKPKKGENPKYYCKTFGQPYECDSIMHYARDQFSSNKGDTIVAKKNNCKLLYFTDWNKKKEYFSSGDVAVLRKHYGGPKEARDGGDLKC